MHRFLNRDVEHEQRPGCGPFVAGRGEAAFS